MPVPLLRSFPCVLHQPLLWLVLSACVLPLQVSPLLADETAAVGALRADSPGRSFLDRLQWRASAYFPTSRSQRAARLIQAGDLAGLQECYAAGLDVNVTGESGVSLLLWAFLAEHRDIYRQLLKWGADPDTPLPLKQPLDIIPGVDPLSSGATVTFLSAVVPGRSDWFVDTVLSGGDPNVTGPPLSDSAFTAVFRRPGIAGPNRFRLLEVLVSHGANINYRNPHGDSALTNAYAAGEWDLAVRLIELGARVDCYDLQDRQFCHRVALTEQLRRRNIGEDPVKQQEWLESPLRRDFERLTELLAARGFPLDQAIADVQRANESVDGMPYMTWRRMQRKGREVCTERPAVPQER